MPWGRTGPCPQLQEVEDWIGTELNGAGRVPVCRRALGGAGVGPWSSARPASPPTTTASSAEAPTTTAACAIPAVGEGAPQLVTRCRSRSSGTRQPLNASTEGMAPGPTRQPPGDHCRRLLGDQLRCSASHRPFSRSAARRPVCSSTSVEGRSTKFEQHARTPR